MTDPRERRRHPRRQVDIPVEIQLPDGARIRAHMGQMSIGGSFIETTEVQRFGVELRLLFRLPGKPTEFTVSATVRWTSPSGMGVQFGAMRAREIYELSQFLVDKPSIPPAAPVPRPPVLGTVRDKTLGATEDARPRGTPAPAAPVPAAPPVRVDVPAPKPAAPVTAEAELDRAQCEIERLASELVQAQDRLERAEAAGLERAERQRYVVAELALRDEQLRKLTPERAQREERLRIVEAELELRNEQLRKLATELGQHERQGQDAVAELARRQAQLHELEAELEQRAAELRTRGAGLEQREAELRAREAGLVQRAEALPELGAQGDDLTRIRGIGRGFERALNGLGVSRFEQIAAWTEAEMQEIAGKLKLTTTRIQRQEWVRQAAALCAERK